MLIDSHCHLDFDVFAQELPELIARAGQAGVGRMVSICTRIRKFDQILAIAERFDNVYCSVGTHPNNAHEELDITVDDIIALTQHPKVVAIGEAGLDYHYDYTPPEAQRQGFLNHIDAGRQTGLPLVIHSRSADADMEQILRDETEKGAFPFILHCYSSGMQLAKAGIELGGYISFSGIVTFKSAGDIAEIAKIVPRERLLVETDAPYLAPVPHRGQRNEPAFVADTAAFLATLLEVDTATIADITTNNCLKLFRKMPKMV